MRYAKPRVLTHHDYQSLLIKCLDPDTKRDYTALDPDGLPIDIFVSFLAERMYQRADDAVKARLNNPFYYSDLKAFLFVVFRSIDVDDDGSATWHEVVEYIIDERIAATEAPKGAEQRWHPTYTVQYASEARLELDTMRKTHDDGPGADNAAFTGGSMRKHLPVLRPRFVTYLDPCNALLFATARRAVMLDPSSFQEIGTMPIAADGLTAVAVAEQIGFAKTHTVVSCHRDTVVRCWAMKDSLTKVEKVFDLEFEYALTAQPTAAVGSPSGMFYVGAADGSITSFDFNKERLQEYQRQRGDARSFNRIVKHCWLPGEWHTCRVSDIAFLDGLPHLLASVARDGVCCLRDVDSPLSQPVRKFHHPKGLLAVATSRSVPTVICTGGFDVSCAVWDVVSHSPHPSLVLRDHNDPHLAAVVGLVAPSSSPMVISVDSMTKMKLWDLRMGQCLQSMFVETDPGPSTNLSRVARMGLPTCATISKRTGSIFVSSRAFHRYDVVMQSPPECCYHTDIVAAAFCERTMHLMTAHSDSVVLWAVDTGCIVAIHPYTPPPIDPVRGEPQEPETIRAFLLAPSGVSYFVGSSRGRVTRHKQRSGELISDTGRIHPCEIKSLAYGMPPNDGDFVLSLGLDGSLRLTTKSMRLPSHLPHILGTSCTIAIYGAAAQQCCCAGESLSVAVFDPYTVTSKGVQTVLNVADEPTAMLVIEELAVLVVLGTTGPGSIFGLRPHARAGYELGRLMMPSGGESSHTHITNGPLVQTSDAVGSVLIFAGDDRGRVACWQLKSFADGTVTACHLWQRSLHTARVGALVYIHLANRLVSIGLDSGGFIVDDEGDVHGQLCHGRGSDHSVWKNGVQPKYRFPDVSAAFATRKAHYLRVIRIVHKFIKLLKRKADRRRLLRKTSLARRSFLQRSSTLQAYGTALSSIYTPPLEAESDTDEVSPHALRSDSRSTEADVKTLLDIRQRCTPETPDESESAPDPVRHLRPSPRGKVSIHKAVPPVAAATPRRRCFSDSLTTSDGLQKATVSTRDRMSSYTGQPLLVVSSQEYPECSPRTTFRVMEAQCVQRAHQHRYLRNLLEQEAKHRHAVTAADQLKYKRIASEVRQIRDREASEKRLREEQRERALRGPPAPPPLISRRPATAPRRFSETVAPPHLDLVL